MLKKRTAFTLNKSMFSDEQITKYQKLYKKRFGKEISREEAHEQGAKLIRLVELIYKPITKNELKQLKKRR
jgi:hypothetical protein